METLERILSEHPFFAGLNPSICKLACGCAKNVRFDPGQYIFHEGDAAEIMKRFMPVLIDRLHATRLQMLDVYGAHA